MFLNSVNDRLFHLKPDIPFNQTNNSIYSPTNVQQMILKTQMQKRSGSPERQALFKGIQMLFSCMSDAKQDGCRTEEKQEDTEEIDGSGAGAAGGR